MNEVMINKKEIESIWEKDHLCFVKMKSGKVWLCEETITKLTKELQKELGLGYSEKDLSTAMIKTSFYIEQVRNDFIKIPLSQRGDKYGR